jgi:hypothetical protein
LASVNSTWAKVQVAERFYPCLLVDSTWRLKGLALLSSNHLLGVAVLNSEERRQGSAEAVRSTSNIIFKLHFYSLAGEDP